ncbi:hypothetical protein PF008_g5011 [Phytophthora fragariae]|uniref:Retrotransposon gag domain-containing protein n=1 Tax=Phytophthora fragariae TaxID=53985 RepID=A0A6G0SAA1_9STRA|nr:hypothetical protein PF008_g5011 [Phytophthora fragariae]
MGRDDKDEYVTNALVMTPEAESIPADMTKIKIQKFKGGGACDWLKCSGQFSTIARKKRWMDEQTAHNFVALIEGDLEADVETAAKEAVTAHKSFEEFFTDVGLLSVPHDVSEDLDNELWAMTRRSKESVLQFSQRPKENICMFAELHQNTDAIPVVQQCRYFKRGTPRAWHEKLEASGVVCDRTSELVLYFTHIERAERGRDRTPRQEQERQGPAQREEP